MIELVGGHQHIMHFSMGTHRAEDDGQQAEQGGKTDAEGAWCGHGRAGNGDAAGPLAFSEGKITRKMPARA